MRARYVERIHSLYPSPSFCLSLSLSVSLSLCLSLSLILSLILSLAHSLSLTHTHTHSLIHAHEQMPKRLEALMQSFNQVRPLRPALLNLCAPARVAARPSPQYRPRRRARAAPARRPALPRPAARA